MTIKYISLTLDHEVLGLLLWLSSFQRLDLLCILGSLGSEGRLQQVLGLFQLPLLVNAVLEPIAGDNMARLLEILECICN